MRSECPAYRRPLLSLFTTFFVETPERKHRFELHVCLRLRLSTRGRLFGDDRTLCGGLRGKRQASNFLCSSFPVFSLPVVSSLPLCLGISYLPIQSLASFEKVPFSAGLIILQRRRVSPRFLLRLQSFLLVTLLRCYHRLLLRWMFSHQLLR